MEFTFERPIVFLPLISTIVILISIMIFIIKGRKTRLLYIMVVFQVLMAFWTFGQILEFIAGNDITIMVSLIFIYISISFMAVVWLVFCFIYTDNKIISSKKKLLPLFVVPFMSLCTMLTNHWHHMYFPTARYEPSEFGLEVVSYGIFFWITAATSYVYIVVGVVLLYRFQKKQSGQLRKQSIILMTAPILTFVVSLAGDLYLFVTGDSSPEIIDFTPTVFIVSILFFIIAAFRYRFQNVLPSALQKIVDNIDDGVLVIDNNNCIVNYNASFEVRFSQYVEIKNNYSITGFISKLRELMIKTETAEQILAAIEHGSKNTLTGELCLNLSEPTFFKVSVYMIVRRNKHYGKIITFSDITPYQRLLQEISIKNQELFVANAQLSEHLKVVEQLAVANERNRIARELHDTLGHTLLTSIMLMKAGKLECLSSPQDTLTKLTEGIHIAEEGLKEMRRTVSGLLSDEITCENLIHSIQRLVQDTRNTGVHIQLSVMGEDSALNEMPSNRMFKVSDTVYKICKEALTNALKHGKATQIDVILKLSQSTVKLFVIDNGLGCKNIHKGFGLTGMTSRAHEVGGNLVFGSDGESGFNIHVEIPIGG